MQLFIIFKNFLFLYAGVNCIRPKIKHTPTYIFCLKTDKIPVGEKYVKQKLIRK